MPLLDLEAPADFGELAVREHMDISNATENALDVTEWVASASAPMSTTDLGGRMGICERFVLDGIIEPMISGTPQTDTDTDKLASTRRTARTCISTAVAARQYSGF